MRRRVIVTDHVFADLEIERSCLTPLGVELLEAPDADESTLADLAREADALLVCYAPISRVVIEAAAAGRVRVISRYGIGYDNVDIGAASDNGILVTNVPDYCTDEVADHTIALLLAAGRGVVRGYNSVREGGWSPRQDGVHSLRGRQLTLVGIGRIGVKVAERALPFGLRVVAYDPFVEESPLRGIALAESLEEALESADFVSLHAPLTLESRHLINDVTVGQMKRAPVLINTSRGGLVDLDVATAALEDRRLSGVAIDVTEPEPLQEEHPLRSHPRAIITPHMAFYSVEAEAELQRRAANEVVRALRKEPPRSPVNAAALAGFDRR